MSLLILWMIAGFLGGYHGSEWIMNIPSSTKACKRHQYVFGFIGSLIAYTILT